MSLEAGYTFFSLTSKMTGIYLRWGDEGKFLCCMSRLVELERKGGGFWFWF